MLLYPEQLPINFIPNYKTDGVFLRGASSLVRAYVNRNYQSGSHSHEFYEINIVTKGSGQHYINDRRFPTDRGDVFVIPPNIKHGYLSEDDPLDVFHILLKNEFVDRYRSELTQIPEFHLLFETEPYLRQVYDRRLFLHMEGEALEDLEKALNRLAAFYENQQENCSNIYALRIICDICVAMGDSYCGILEKCKTDAEIIRVMEYLNIHFAEKITVDDLAELVHMSRSSFNRRFKKVTSCSPWEYVMSRRTREARRLMESTTLSKTEIAHACGFYDLSHMEKCLEACGG